MKKKNCIAEVQTESSGCSSFFVVKILWHSADIPVKELPVLVEFQRILNFENQ